MDILQTQVQGWLESSAFRLLDVADGFVVADRPEIGGYRDTRVLWIPPPPVRVDDFRRLERQLLQDFETEIARYPNARYWMTVHTLEGFSRDFLAEARRLRISLRTAIQFFDTPFNIEDAPGAASIINSLRDRELLSKRVPQPYGILVDGQLQDQGDDLLPHLFDELTTRGGPCLRVIVGAAGAGKSVLFKALFTRLYEHFLDEKRKQSVFPRPFPLVPEHLRGASAPRVGQLITSFLGTDVAAPVSPAVFKWMLANGYGMWMFDGLDELYAGDQEFFDHLLDPLTRPEAKAQILMCARSSLLSSCEPFIELLDEFPPGTEDMLRVYKLTDWDQSSKRTFAWISLEERRPISGQPDPPQVSEFLSIVTRSSSLQALSGLPYYCDLLMGEFKEGRTLADFANDFTLIDEVVKGITAREMKKGQLLEEEFEPDGLNQFLETVALESYEDDFGGLAKTDMEQYGRLVLHEQLPEDRRPSIMTKLIQFPLFGPGVKPGVISFKHELICEYLAGKYLLRRITKDPGWVARALGTRNDLAESLIMRYMASGVGAEQGGVQAVINALKALPLSGRAFTNLLQLLLLSTPVADVITANDIKLEQRDLKHVQFEHRDLRNVSFRYCDLTNTGFVGCGLQNARFEAAHLVGTRFENSSRDSLTGARFGNLDRFECIYFGKQRIDNHKDMITWVRRETGVTEELSEPCPAALQLRTLFLKFMNRDGTARRHELPETGLIRGKRHRGAPNPEDCVEASLRLGFLEGGDFRGRIRRATGDKYSDMVHFVRDWRLTTDIRQLLNSLCKEKGCEHVPTQPS